jgi:hypothetical protein
MKSERLQFKGQHHYVESTDSRTKGLGEGKFEVFDFEKWADNMKSKGKGKLHPRTGNEGPEGKQIYSSTLPSTSALDGSEVVKATPWPLYPRESPSTHCIGAWLWPRAGLDGCGQVTYIQYMALLPRTSTSCL